MTPETPMSVPSPAFTPAQWQALHALRTRYQQDRDLFSARERARLRFVRWLYQTGRLVPQGHPRRDPRFIPRATPRDRTEVTPCETAP